MGGVVNKLTHINPGDRMKIIQHEIDIAISSQDTHRILQIFAYLSPKEGAKIIELAAHQRYKLIQTIRHNFNYDILDLLSEEVRREVVLALNKNKKPKYNDNIDSDKIIQTKIAEAIKAINEYDTMKIEQIFDSMRPSDAATIIEFLTSKQRLNLIKMLGNNFDGEILTFLDSSILYDLVHKIDPKYLALLISSLQENDIMEIIHEMDLDRKKTLLHCLSKIIDKEKLRYIKKSFYYEDNTAGRIMFPTMSVSSSYTIYNTYKRFYENKKLPKESQMIYIYDNEDYEYRFSLIGQIYLSDLCRLSQKKETKFETVRKFMSDIPCFVYTNTHIKDIAFLFKKYYTPEIPVINYHNKRLVGVINTYQAIDILDMMNKNTVFSLVGLKESDFYENTFNTVFARFRLLGLASGATVFSCLIISKFDSILESNRILVSILPLAAAIAGNAANQVLVVTVRALSNKEIGPSNKNRAILKELTAGFASGTMIGIILGIVLFMYCRNLNAAIVLGLTISASTTLAATFGVVTPIFIDQYLRKDASLASIFMNIMTDVAGYSFLFLFASIFM